MALYGYAGKTLRLDLTNRKAIVLDTERYKSWGGGHGLGAVFTVRWPRPAAEPAELRESAGSVA